MEIPFGCAPEQIRELCEGKKMSLSDATVRDQFRAVHGKMTPNEQKGAYNGGRNPYITIPLSRKSKTSKVPQPHGQSSSSTHQDKPRDGQSDGGQGSRVPPMQAQGEPTGAKQKEGPPPSDAPHGVTTELLTGTQGAMANVDPTS